MPPSVSSHLIQTVGILLNPGLVCVAVASRDTRQGSPVSISRVMRLMIGHHASLAFTQMPGAQTLAGNAFYPPSCLTPVPLSLSVVASSRTLCFLVHPPASYSDTRDFGYSL